MIVTLQDTPDATEIRNHVQRVRNMGEYVRINADGSFVKILHSEVESSHSFEERISLLSQFKLSKHDLADIDPDDKLCYALTKHYFNK